jgi:hypothetical protein
MVSNRFPVRLRGVYRNLRPEELLHLLSDFCVCAQVTVRTRTPFAATVEDGKLIFPVGEFNAYLSTPELEYAFQNEDVLRVQACAVYEPGSPFGHFVHDLYDRKVRAARDGKLVEAGHYKLLLNSFSGKWGQNGIKWKTLGRAKSQRIRFARVLDFDTRQVTQYRTFLGRVQVKETIPESANSHPAIAAHITSHGRMRLWALLRQVSPENRFYCDTDSILVNEDGLKQVGDISQNEILGALRQVGQYADGFIHGCKDYVLDGRRTCKGIRDQAIEVDPGTYHQDKWVGFRTALANGWLDGPRTQSLVKHLRRVYDKGRVAPSGFVFPLHRPL